MRRRPLPYPLLNFALRSGGIKLVLPTPPVGNQSDLMAWYDASQLSFDAGQSVSSIQDLSGNYRLASQSNSANQPVVALQAGLKELKFDGIQDFLTSQLALPSVHSIIICYSNRAGANGSLYSTASTRRPLQRNSAFWQDENIAQNVFTGGKTLNNSNVLQLDMDYTANSYQSYLDNVANTASSIVGGGVSPSLVEFGRRDTEYLNGDICEIFVYNRILTTTERNTIYSYLTKKWGLLVPNNTFETNTTGWTPYVNGGSATPPIVTFDAGECKIDLQGTYANAGIESSTAVQFEAGGVYRLYWDARSAVNTTMNIYIGHSSNPSGGGYNITATKSTQFFEFTTPTAGSGIVYLRTASPATTIWVDNIYLRKVNQSPTNLGLIGWYNASNVLQTSNIVSQLTDISGNSNHLTQATAGQQPLLVANSLNSLPTVNFDGVDDFLESSGLILTGNVHTVFLVYSHNYTVTTNKYVLNSGSNTTGFGYQTRNGNTRCYVVNNISAKLDGIATNNQFEILSSTNDISSNYNYYVNNSLQLSGVQTLNPPTGKFTLASRNGEVGGNAEMKIAELLIYNRVLTQAEQTTVYQFLKTKYNI